MGFEECDESDIPTKTIKPNHLMFKIKSALGVKKLNVINKRVKTGFGLLLLSLFINHIAQKDSFPFIDNYNFPLLSTIVSIVIGTIVLIIADINFKYFKEKHFQEKITVQLLLRFLLSTLGYIALAYIPIYFVAVWLKEGSYEFYYFLTGLLLTLLLSSLAIIIIFSKAIYQLHKLETIRGKINFKKSGKTYIIDYTDIAYIFSELKIVYIVTTDGKNITTDFTLNELEDKVNDHLFFRANRQTIINHNSIESSQAIVNGKLLVTLKTRFPEKDNYQIMISRYKKKAYEEWFSKKL